VGILGAANIPIVHFSVTWWRALHQPAAILGPGSAPMPLWMKGVLALNWLALTLLFAYFLTRRIEIARIEESNAG
jgi:heme exporter protein C